MGLQIELASQFEEGIDGDMVLSAARIMLYYHLTPISFTL